MNALVVYESIWGNTAALARAVGQGIGLNSKVLPTSDATPEQAASTDLLVLGAPMHSFGLPELRSIERVRDTDESGHSPAELAITLMIDWLATLPPGAGRPAAVFETSIESLVGEGGAAAALRALDAAGYRLIDVPVCFVVERLPVDTGPGSWIRPGELERAQRWGSRLWDIVTDDETREFNGNGVENGNGAGGH